MTPTKTTAPKGAPTPKRQPNKTATPGPKPEFQRIGDLLYYNAPKTGIEVVVDVDPPFSVLEQMLNAAEQDDLDERQQFQMVLGLLGDEDTLTQVRKLRTSEFFALCNRYIDDVQAYMGVGLGESGGSDSDSGSTETP